MNVVESTAAYIEQTLNPVDWFPLVSSFSGMIRILSGFVEIAASAAFVYLKSVHLFLTTTTGCMDFALKEGAVYFIHGTANILRGAIAMIPGVNLLLCIYDHKIGRLTYPLEEVAYSEIYSIVI